VELNHHQTEETDVDVTLKGGPWDGQLVRVTGPARPAEIFIASQIRDPPEAEAARTPQDAGEEPGSIRFRVDTYARRTCRDGDGSPWVEYHYVQ
jgi:hypothetical protein